MKPKPLGELRMPAAEFDKIMSQALRAQPERPERKPTKRKKPAKRKRAGQ